MDSKFGVLASHFHSVLGGVSVGALVPPLVCWLWAELGQWGALAENQMEGEE